MSGILEKLHLKHPAQPAAGHPIAGQPLAGQQFVGQPLVGQTTLVGQPLVGQQTSYVQTTGVPFTNVGQPLMAGQTSYSSTTTTSSISGGSLAGTSYVQQPLMTGLPLGAQQTSFTSWDQVYTGQSFPMGQFGYPRLTREQKASRFEQKAMEWERRGDLRKAQKNREKALRHRQFLAPGYVAQPRPQNYYMEKLQRLDQKHQFYNRNGNTLKAQRAQQRSMRLRQKHTFLQTFVGQSSMAMQHETIVKPAIIQETVRTDRIVEVQPVIHKEIDQTIVHHVEKHITEAPAANRGGVVQMAPIIQETVVRHEVDEIQPVVHREIATAVVERVEEHKSERLVAPTQHTNQVVYDNSGALAGGLVKTTTTITSWDQVYTGQSFPMGQFGYPRLTREQKASRFEQKAMEWERRGDLRKAQKNREKALRHRQFLAPGYVAQPRPQNYYMDKLHRLDQQNQLYTRNGNTLKAQRAQQRSMRLRQKHNLPHEKFPLSSLAPGLAAGGPLPSGRAF